MKHTIRIITIVLSLCLLNSCKDKEKEAAAWKLYEEAFELQQEGEDEKARSYYKEVMSRYSGTEASKSATGKHADLDRKLANQEAAQRRQEREAEAREALLARVEQGMRRIKQTYEKDFKEQWKVIHEKKIAWYKRYSVSTDDVQMAFDPKEKRILVAVGVRYKHENPHIGSDGMNYMLEYDLDGKNPDSAGDDDLWAYFKSLDHIGYDEL